MEILFKTVLFIFFAIALFGFFFTKKFLEIFYRFNSLYYKICGIDAQFKTNSTKITKILCLLAILFISFIFYDLKTETFSKNFLNTEKQSSNLIILKNGGAIEAKIEKEDDTKICIQQNHSIINKNDIDTIIKINNKDFLDVIFNRNSCHYFKYGPKIPDEHIQLMLRAAMSSPSGYNLKTWSFIVVKDKKLIEELLLPIIDEPGVERGRLNANVMFVVCAKENSYQNFYTDQLLSAVYLWLCAEYLNYAATFVDIILPDSVTRINLFKEKLSIPKDITPYYMILVGYYDREKKPLNKFDESNIHYNSW